jgi:hypothetical protein
LTGIGSRAVSSAHQHDPDNRLQVNSVPQPEQARRRDGGGLSDRFVMQQSLRPKESNRQLNYEGRDLAPTSDLRAVIKGLLHDHLGVAERVLAESIFPDSAPVKPMRGLLG